MKALRRPCVVVWSCLTAALLSAGCQPGGPPRFVASGTILLNDKPLAVPSGMPPGEMAVRVQLFPDVGADPSKSAVSQICSYDAATGKFKTTGADDKGVEAGKYRVVLTHFGDDAAPTPSSRGEARRSSWRSRTAAAPIPPPSI